jgi:hypothetical protein
MNSQRYQELLGRLLEGGLSEAEAGELAAELRERPELQRDMRSHLVLWELWSQQHTPERSAAAFLNGWKTRLRVEEEDSDVFADAMRTRIDAPPLRTGAIVSFVRVLGAIRRPKGMAWAASMLIVISAAILWFAGAKSAQAITVLKGEAVCTACVLHETQDHAPALRVVAGLSTNIYYVDSSPALAALQSYFCSGPTTATAEGKARVEKGRRLFQAATVTFPEANRPNEKSINAAIKKPGAASVQAVAMAKHYPLESVQGLRFRNVTAEPSVLQGKNGLRATISEETLRSAEGTQQNAQGLLWIEGLDFSNGVIEAEIAGDLAPGAGGQARGFVGIAFRVQENLESYDAFYLRPTNGRAEDQERRNHSVQYISLPEWPWSRLRKETPSKYEAYVDLVPGAWTKIKIEVHGEQARLYVHDNEQPTLIVKDLKSGANGHGGVALWLEPGTVAHFRNLTVAPSAPPAVDQVTPPPSIRNSLGMQLKVIEENTQPTLRIVLPGHPPSDRSIEVLFPEHVTVRQRGSADGKQLYMFQPGQNGERPLWRRSERSLEYERNLPGPIHMLARATLDEDGVRFHFKLRNESDNTYDLVWAIVDPRLTSIFHDVRLERTYVHHADGFDLLASETPSRLTMPLNQWLPARYLASFTWPIPSQLVERRDGIAHYNKSRAVDAPFIATLSQDGHWLVASFTRNTGNVWSNPELTCQHVDPQAALSPGEEAILESKILVVPGSLDDVFRMAIQQRESLKVEVRRWNPREK